LKTFSLSLWLWLQTNLYTKNKIELAALGMPGVTRLMMPGPAIFPLRSRRPWISLCSVTLKGTKGILPLLKLVIARHRENSRLPPPPRFARHE
jgi:hypothetical protein